MCSAVLYCPLIQFDFSFSRVCVTHILPNRRIPIPGVTSDFDPTVCTSHDFILQKMHYRRQKVNSTGTTTQVPSCQSIITKKRSQKTSPISGSNLLTLTLHLTCTNVIWLVEFSKTRYLMHKLLSSF